MLWTAKSFGIGHDLRFVKWRAIGMGRAIFHHTNSFKMVTTSSCVNHVLHSRYIGCYWYHRRTIFEWDTITYLMKASIDILEAKDLVLATSRDWDVRTRFLCYQIFFLGALDSWTTLALLWLDNCPFVISWAFFQSTASFNAMDMSVIITRASRTRIWSPVVTCVKSTKIIEQIDK